MTNELLNHLIATVFKTQKLAPDLVWESVYQQFYIDSLHKKGFSNLEDLSYLALKTLWKKTFWNEKLQKYAIGFDPKPSIYSFRPCYREIFYGVCGLKATTYKGTPTYFLIQNSQGKVLKRIDDNKLFYDANKTLWFIGKSDPIIPNYLKGVFVENETTTLEFNLTKAQLEQMHILKDSP